MDTLQHDDDYDPVKAHEYYMRTRELKGRPSGSSGGPTLTRGSASSSSPSMSFGRKVRSNQLQPNVSDPSKVVAEANARLEKLQADAQEAQMRIVEKFKALVDKLRGDVDIEVPKPKLNTIPETASPRQKAFLQKQNSRLIKEYNTKQKVASDKANATIKEASVEAKEAIKKVGTDLKEAVAKARAEYQAAKKLLSGR